MTHYVLFIVSFHENDKISVEELPSFEAKSSNISWNVQDIGEQICPKLQVCLFIDSFCFGERTQQLRNQHVPTDVIKS